MKIYSQLIDLSKTTPQNFFVPPNSKFKLGVKLVQGTDFSVKLNGVALESDGEIDGFKTFSLESTNPGNTIYVVEAANGQKVNIMQTTTTSTVFDVDSGSLSINGEFPVDGNIDVSKLVYTTESGNAEITGADIANSLNNINASLANKLEQKDIVPVAPSTDATPDQLAGARATAEFVNSSFVKTVNGDLPVNGNIDVSKLVYTDGDGKAELPASDIANSLKSIDASLANKLERSDIVPIAPSTDAPEEALAGARQTAEFVNSSVATNTANFAGTFTSESEFPAVATNNDYLFLDTVDEEGNKIFKRYKYASDTSRWVYEYTLNNSSFTAAQWAAIQSGITAEIVNDIARKSELDAHTIALTGEYDDGTPFNYTVYVKTV